MSAVDNLVNYYQNLLVIEYRNKPNARAVIDKAVRPLIMDNLSLLVQSAYDVTTAVGVQLDVLGKFVGVKRQVVTFTGRITLVDGDFRQLIRMKIFRNNSTSSLADIQKLISIFFPKGLQVFDYQNMHMDYFFDAAFGSMDLAEAFVRQGLLPKPGGVQLGALVYGANLTKVFGFRTTALDGVNISGFNSASAYTTNTPWLNGSNMIIF